MAKSKVIEDESSDGISSSDESLSSFESNREHVIEKRRMLKPRVIGKRKRNDIIEEKKDDEEELIESEMSSDDLESVSSIDSQDEEMEDSETDRFKESKFWSLYQLKAYLIFCS